MSVPRFSVVVLERERKGFVPAAGTGLDPTDPKSFLTPRAPSRPRARQQVEFSDLEIRHSLRAATVEWKIRSGYTWVAQAPYLPYPAEVQISFEDELYVRGFVDRLGRSDLSREGEIQGRCVVADLVDSSVWPSLGLYDGVDFRTIAEELASRQNVRVEYQNLDPETVSFQEFVTEPGESGFEAIERAARAGGILLTSTGQALRCHRLFSADDPTVTPVWGAPLIEGQNVKNAGFSTAYDARYTTYRVVAQQAGTDEAWAEQAAEVLGEAVDADPVVRQSRHLVVVGETGMDAGTATRRAEWEASVRASEGLRLSVTVDGWFEREGKRRLWQPGMLTRVTFPSFRIDSSVLLVEGVRIIQGETIGTVADLDLVRPDAYIAEPVVEKWEGDDLGWGS